MPTDLYRERVLPSGLTFGLAPLLGLFVYAIALPLDAVLGLWLAIAATLILTVCLYSLAPVIVVTPIEIRVGRATIERRFLAAIREISAEEIYAERGHKLDARAFTSFQASVRSALKVELADPTDPTPYWLFSTRRPEELRYLLEN
jgi:hypothetical protein